MVACSHSMVNEPVVKKCILLDYFDYQKRVSNKFTMSEEDAHNSLLVGDSRVGAMALYNLSEDIEVHYIESLALSKIKITYIKDSDLTIYDVMEQSQKKNIYLLIGINEIGFKSFEKWRSVLNELVETYQLAHPDKNIYLIGSYNVSKSYQMKKDELIEKVAQLNEAIFEVAKNRYVYFLNLNDVFLGEDGFVDKTYVRDGIHFTKEGAQLFKEYLKTHVAGDYYVKEICD